MPVARGRENWRYGSRFGPQPGKLNDVRRIQKKWSRYQGNETSACQGHFDDLCRLLGQPTPAEAGPSGSESFCCQKRVVKDAELFDLHETPDASEPTGRGFADVWKKGFFAWEAFREKTGDETL
jgi:hypothetical protein